MIIREEDVIIAIKVGKAYVNSLVDAKILVLHEKTVIAFAVNNRNSSIHPYVKVHEVGGDSSLPSAKNVRDLRTEKKIRVKAKLNLAMTAHELSPGMSGDLIQILAPHMLQIADPIGKGMVNRFGIITAVDGLSDEWNTAVAEVVATTLFARCACIVSRQRQSAIENDSSIYQNI